MTRAQRDVERADRQLGLWLVEQVETARRVERDDVTLARDLRRRGGVGARQRKVDVLALETLGDVEQTDDALLKHASQKHTHCSLPGDRGAACRLVAQIKVGRQFEPQRSIRARSQQLAQRLT